MSANNNADAQTPKAVPASGTKTKFHTYEAQARLIAAIIASQPEGLKLDYKNISKYFGDGRTASSIEHVLRAARGQANVARACVEKGVDPFEISQEEFLGVKDVGGGEKLIHKYFKESTPAGIEFHLRGAKKTAREMRAGVDTPAATTTPTPRKRKTAAATPATSARKKARQTMMAEDEDDDDEAAKSLLASGGVKVKIEKTASSRQKRGTSSSTPTARPSSSSSSAASAMVGYGPGPSPAFDIAQSQYAPFQHPQPMQYPTTTTHQNHQNQQQQYFAAYPAAPEFNAEYHPHPRPQQQQGEDITGYGGYPEPPQYGSGAPSSSSAVHSERESSASGTGGQPEYGLFTRERYGIRFDGEGEGMPFGGQGYGMGFCDGQGGQGREAGEDDGEI